MQLVIPTCEHHRNNPIQNMYIKSRYTFKNATSGENKKQSIQSNYKLIPNIYIYIYIHTLITANGMWGQTKNQKRFLFSHLFLLINAIDPKAIYTTSRVKRFAPTTTMSSDWWWRGTQLLYVLSKLWSSDLEAIPGSPLCVFQNGLNSMHR